MNLVKELQKKIIKQNRHESISLENPMLKIASDLQRLIDEYVQTLKTDRYKENATINVDEYYADLQKVIEDLRRIKKYIDSNLF